MRGIYNLGRNTLEQRGECHKGHYQAPVSGIFGVFDGIFQVELTTATSIAGYADDLAPIFTNVQWIKMFIPCFKLWLDYIFKTVDNYLTEILTGQGSLERTHCEPEKIGMPVAYVVAKMIRLNTQPSCVES